MPRPFYKNGIYFECQPDCAECCKVSGGFVYLSQKEAEEIAEFLNCSLSEFKDFFTRQVDDRLALLDGENEACIFLENNQCTIYEARPLQCRFFPFWPENLRSQSAWQQTKQLCPGIGKGSMYSAAKIDNLLEQQKKQ